MPEKPRMDALTRRTDEGVIDATTWLKERVEALIAQQRFDDAIGYLRMLAVNVSDEDQQRQCAKYLGYLYLLVDNTEESRAWLEKGRRLSLSDPHLAYALGHVALDGGAHAEATVRFLEAFVEGETAYDEAEFLRSAALSMMKVLGPGVPVAGMLLGALDRDLGNPWILDALARVYEADQRLLDSLETLSMLAEVVQHTTDSMVVHRAPPARQLLWNRLMGQPASPADLRRRAEEINQSVREQFQIVLAANHRRGPTGLAALRFPLELSRLVSILDWQQRGVELVERAQNIWARATAENFDQMLGAPRLAAAVQVLVERLHWRVPTPLSEIARLHGASPAAIPAAARVVAGRLGLQLFDEMAFKKSLSLVEKRRIEELSRALLFGERLADVRAGEIRLGG